MIHDSQTVKSALAEGLGSVFQPASRRFGCAGAIDSTEDIRPGSDYQDTDKWSIAWFENLAGYDQYFRFWYLCDKLGLHSIHGGQLWLKNALDPAGRL
jgi:hypothetical protein